MKKLVVLVILVLSSLLGSSADGSDEQCGQQAGNATCPDGMCCSAWGYCGLTIDYCGNGCQSQCDAVSLVINEAKFEELLIARKHFHTDDLYTYNGFIFAANSFKGFGTTGDEVTRKREIAAFLAQTSYETKGHLYNQHVGYTVKEYPGGDDCSPSEQWPCAPGRKYYRRGPFMIQYNYNYGPAGQAINVDLLDNPDLVATDPIVTFKTALWFWMTPISPKPSLHDAITGGWIPSSNDIAAGRLPGFGATTNIINGDIVCGKGHLIEPLRIVFYRRYCDILGVSYGDNVNCNNQAPFSSSIAVE